DEEHLVLPLLWLFAFAAHNQNAGRDARTVEKIGRQADDRLDVVVVYELLPNLFLFAAPEQDAVRHDRRHQPTDAKDAEHVLGKHQVGLLPRLRGKAVVEAVFKLQFRLTVILGERRIRDHAIEPHELSAVSVLGVHQYVIVADVRSEDAVEEHVHLADGPDAAITL